MQVGRRVTVTNIAQYLSTPSDTTQGATLDSGSRFIVRDSGTLTECSSPNLDQFGDAMKSPKAMGRVSISGTLTGGRGIASVSKTGTDMYLLVLDRYFTATSSMWVFVTSVGGSSPHAQADTTSTSTITVAIKNATGSFEDGGFHILVHGY